MNIFYLDTVPAKAAKYHNDSHCRKMVVETAQLLSTAHRVLDGALSTSNTRYTLAQYDDVVYHATHVNHPCAVWTRQDASTYHWAYLLFKELSKEFTHRYKKPHLSWHKLGSF